MSAIFSALIYFGRAYPPAEIRKKRLAKQNSVQPVAQDKYLQKLLLPDFVPLPLPM
jgi:hypothetical protein